MLVHTRDPKNSIELPIFTERLEVFHAGKHEVTKDSLDAITGSKFVRGIWLSSTLPDTLKNVGEIIKIANEHFDKLGSIDPTSLRIVEHTWGLVQDPFASGYHPLVPYGYHLAAEVELIPDSEAIDKDSELGLRVDSVHKSYFDIHSSDIV